MTYVQFVLLIIACRFAAIIYQHPFQARFEKQVAFWTNATMSDSSETDQVTGPQQYIRCTGYHNTTLDDKNWMQMTKSCRTMPHYVMTDAWIVLFLSSLFRDDVL